MIKVMIFEYLSMLHGCRKHKSTRLFIYLWENKNKQTQTEMKIERGRRDQRQMPIFNV